MSGRVLLAVDGRLEDKLTVGLDVILDNYCGRSRVGRVVTIADEILILGSDLSGLCLGSNLIRRVSIVRHVSAIGSIVICPLWGNSICRYVIINGIISRIGIYRRDGGDRLGLLHSIFRLGSTRDVNTVQREHHGQRHGEHGEQPDQPLYWALPTKPPRFLLICCSPKLTTNLARRTRHAGSICIPCGGACLLRKAASRR